MQTMNTPPVLPTPDGWIRRTARRFATWLTVTGWPARWDQFFTKGWPHSVYAWITGFMKGIISFDRTVVALALSLTSLLGVGALVAEQAASQHSPTVTVHVTGVCATPKVTK